MVVLNTAAAIPTQHVMLLSQAIPVSVQQEFGRSCTFCETLFSAIDVLLLVTHMSPYHLLLIHLQAQCSMLQYLFLLFSPAMRTLFLCWLLKRANSSKEPHTTSISSLTVRWVDVLLWNNVSVTHRISFSVLRHISYQMDLKKGTLLLCLIKDKKCLSVRNLIYPKNFHKGNLLNQMNSFDYSISISYINVFN